MGRLNIGFLYGRVSKKPVIISDGEVSKGMFSLDCVRSLRVVDDNVKFVKHSNILVISDEKEILDKIVEYEENDIVSIKGVVTSKPFPKTSFCPYCQDEEGQQTRNKSIGNVVYVTPIHIEKLKSYGDDKEAAKEDVLAHREISNQIYVLGTIIKEPKIYTTKQGIQITQYPIAINRKFTIRSDDPTIKTDYPIVKSYGEQAREDKLFLKYQAEVIIDGFLQARTVTRKCKCEKCGKIYEWPDHAMELVPYDVEYVENHRSKEEVEAEGKSVEELKQMLFASGLRDELDEELKSNDVTENEPEENVD